jgi:DNA-binding PadR family transcriptional regulator
LEDEGLVAAKDVEGKKIFEITEAGRTFLEEHRDVVEEIFDRVEQTVERVMGGAMVDVNRAVGRLVKAVYRTGWKVQDDGARRKVAEVLARAADEIEALTPDR